MQDLYATKSRNCRNYHKQHNKQAYKKAIFNQFICPNTLKSPFRGGNANKKPRRRDEAKFVWILSGSANPPG